MMGMVLSSVGIPLEGIGVILGIDRILEMLRTMINITGDCTVTLIVDKMEGTFNKKIYYSKNKALDPQLSFESNRSYVYQGRVGSVGSNLC